MAHTTSFVAQNSVPSDLQRWFFDDQHSVAAVCNKGSLYCMDAQDLNRNIGTFKGAGYYLHSVKPVLHKNAVVATWLQPHAGSRGDPLATAFEGVSPDGYSVVVKKECVVCRRTPWHNKCCRQCRVVHYCSEGCRMSDSTTHQQWCEAPKYYAEAFQDGIDKVRAAIYKRKVFNALEEWWMTPKADGRCGYAEWSWRKMKEDLEPQGVKF